MPVASDVGTIVRRTAIRDELAVTASGGTTEPLDLDSLRQRIDRFQPSDVNARYGDWTLRSAFQPIFSAAHRQRVGDEALLRPFDVDGRPVAAPLVLGQPASPMELLYLDRLSRTVHFENFLRQSPGLQWLFINVHPTVFPLSPTVGTFFADLLRTSALPRGAVVVEVLEDVADDPSALRDAAQFYRDIGCLLAVDDFGVGHSNVDRIWALQPDFVKLDRSLARRALRDPRIRHVVASLVATLHDMQAWVLWEGLERADHVSMALDCGVDFLQGYGLGHPEPELVAADSSRAVIEGAWREFRRQAARDHAVALDLLAPYREAMEHAVESFENECTVGEAFAELLELPLVRNAFVLDDEGNQHGSMLLGAARADLDGDRCNPTAGLRDANWGHRPYFRRAMRHAGVVQVSRPYLGTHSGGLCVTVSAQALRDGTLWVLCGHLAWSADLADLSALD